MIDRGGPDTGSRGREIVRIEAHTPDSAGYSLFPTPYSLIITGDAP